MVKDHKTGTVFEDRYDYLILSPGAKAIKPKSIKGEVDLPNVFTLKNVEDVRKIDNHLKSINVEDVVVVGGGFIGLEVGECLKHSGKMLRLLKDS